MTNELTRGGARPDPARIMGMASAFYESCVLFTASDLGLFAELARSQPAEAGAVAAACGLSTRGAELLLNACVALGLLTRDERGRYANTAESAAFLVPGAPGDLSRAIRYNRDVYPAWGRLAELVKTGRPVEKPALHLGGDAERTRTFVLAMHGRAMGIGRAVVPHLDLAGRSRLLDIGGGPGAYSMLLARRWPELRCTTIDLPGVSRVAAELVAAEGLADRVECVAGDYHEAAFPRGFDAAILFGILHQEEPEAIAGLFRRTYAALEPGGVVYVLDMMTDATHCRPAFSALFALNMALTAEHGWVFSDAELKALMAEAGFEPGETRPVPPPMPHWLVSAVKR